MEELLQLLPEEAETEESVFSTVSKRRSDMHAIGNEQDAKKILDWVRSFDAGYYLPSCVEEEIAPEGWEFLGRGSFRSVWLSPEGVAYKVEHDLDGSMQSAQEVGNLTGAWRREVPSGCRLPMFQGFDFEGETVVAIERIEGETLYEFGDHSGELYGLMHRLARELNLRDLHDENVMVDEKGLLVPVDFGY